MASGITLHFLQASRCIRTAWQLHLLGLDYNLKFSDRENGLAPAAFKQAAGALGKFPTLEDNGEVFYESGNICEYLCDKYDTAHRLLPAPGDPHRYKVLQWVHASEATFALHGISVLYIRLHQKTGDVEATEKGASVNIGKDLDYLEDVLAKSSGKFIFGDEVTAADVMMHFSAVFILQRQLVPKGREGDWPGVRRWIQDCEATESYKEAVKKTGHKI